MNDMREKDHGDIRVADITIAQLSRGLYRSTATAFKELVSNAYDADATEVRIDTNYPEFDFISCIDDGTGMPLEQFLWFFRDQGIGSCIKRKHGRDRTSIYERPIIGRLGIGVLAIGQLCHSFDIESHYKDENGEGKAYHAKIVLADVDIPDKEEFIRDDDPETREVGVGTWRYEVIDYEEAKQGFRIYSPDVRNTFGREMRSSIGEKEREKMSFSLSDLHSEFYDKAKKSVRDCKPYLETIWELAILCPLAYHGEPEEYPIHFASFASEERESHDFKLAAKLIRDRQSRFLNDNFRLIFDGIELWRHIQLPTESETIPKLYHIEFDDLVFDSPLAFSGYIFAQVPRAIRPFELNGVQIRLRGVGIGGYDGTFLRYSEQIETIRCRWVSGEIFVDVGLERALNIDRDSFNEHDEHFKTLQRLLHEKLDRVFAQIDAIARKRQEYKRYRKDQEVRKLMGTIISEESKGEFRLLQRDLKRDAPIIVVDEDRKEIILNTASRPVGRKSPDKIIRAVMLAYHAATRTTETEEDRENKFYWLLRQILGKLV